MGVVPSDVKLRRRRAARWRFLLEHPEPPSIDEWERMHPKATREEREEAEWGREEWEGLAQEKARPYFRKPTARQAAQQRAAKLETLHRARPEWMKDLDWGGADTERRERKLAKRRRRAENRARGFRKYAVYAEDYCAAQCAKHVERVEELQRRKRTLWKARPDAGAEFDRMDRRIALATTAVTRCEQSCFDKELGRGYRKARGFEFTGRKIPHYVAEATQAKYRKLIHTRQRLTAENIRRREWEKGLIEAGGPVILPHKGYADVARQRSFIRFQTKLCTRLKKADKRQQCQRRVAEMRTRLKDIIVWHRDRCKMLSTRAAQRKCLRELRAG
jgi:hypothetical protein